MVTTCGGASAAVIVRAADNDVIDGTRYVTLEHAVTAATGRLAGVAAPAAVGE